MRYGGRRARNGACAIVAAAGLGLAGTAEAQTSTVSGTQGSDLINNFDKFVAPIVRDQVRNATGAVQKRIADVDQRANAQANAASGGAGLAAGDAVKAKGVWGDITSSHISTRNTDSVVNGTGQQDGTSDVATFGLDGQWGKWVLGTAVSANFADVDLDNDGRNRSVGVSITPYAGLAIDDVWSLGAQAGYTRSNYDLVLRRRDANSARGNFDSDRFLAAANANAFKAFDAWQLTGTAGLLYARENAHHFDLKTANGGPTQRASPGALQLGQFKLGGEVGYLIDSWEPYAGAMLEVDFINLGTDRVGGVYKGGFRYHFENGTTAGFEGSIVGQRNEEQNFSVGGNFRYEF